MLNDGAAFDPLQNVKEQTNADLRFRKQNTTDRAQKRPAATMHLHIEPHVRRRHLSVYMYAINGREVLYIT